MFLKKYSLFTYIGKHIPIQPSFNYDHMFKMCKVISMYDKFSIRCKIFTNKGGANLCSIVTQNDIVTLPPKVNFQVFEYLVKRHFARLDTFGCLLHLH